jgi:hypothetical protein
MYFLHFLNGLKDFELFSPICFGFLLPRIYLMFVLVCFDEVNFSCTLQILLRILLGRSNLLCLLLG